MFLRFYHYRAVWNNAVHCMAELDALCALALVSQEEKMVRPRVLPKSEAPFMRMREMRHPCVMNQTKDFVANDVDIEFDSQRTLLITGPNMGGKSTLLRATCLVAILAQVGCYVPAKECEFTVVDQIYTRIGASDRILENLSTFKLELSDTKTILENANKHSLVIMDELGRGTSTFDGYAIAHSVLNFLLTQNKCRLLFTTHYHWLVDDFKLRPGLALYHMSIDEAASKPNSASKSSEEGQKGKRGRKPKAAKAARKVTFLFKFVPGTAKSSFGICVGEMAGLPQSVLDVAESKSKEFNNQLEAIKARRKCEVSLEKDTSMDEKDPME